MSLEKVSSFLGEITYGQISPSVATLEKFNKEIADRVDVEGLKNESKREIKTDICKGEKR